MLKLKTVTCKLMIIVLFQVQKSSQKIKREKQTAPSRISIINYATRMQRNIHT